MGEFDKQDEENKKRAEELKNGPAPTFNIGNTVSFNDETHAEQAKKEDEQRTTYKDWGIDPRGKVTQGTKGHFVKDADLENEENSQEADPEDKKSPVKAPEEQEELDEDELEEQRLAKLREDA